MKKALIISTVSRQFTLFERGNIEVLKKLGYQIYGVANYQDRTEALDELDIYQYHIDIQRNPFKIQNIKSYFQLLKLLKKEKFEMVHCHAPMGGVIGRLAAKKVGVKKVLYTAHGFHFYKGAPNLNWLIYYPIEKWLSKYTDILITINEEDYKLALKKLKPKRVEKINGIGIRLDKFSSITNQEKISLRKRYGYNNDEKILIYIGELSDRKNQKILIDSMVTISKNVEKIRLLLVGTGPLHDEYHKLILKLNLEDKVQLLGYRTDVKQLLQLSDIYVCSSKQEGLPVNIMEAMAVGLPIICSNIRGNVDLIENEKGGYLFEYNDASTLAKYVLYLLENPIKVSRMVENNQTKILNYDVNSVKNKMINIYTT
ncbi:glycosyltransferase family 4 protein [Turicibacter bilis]|uniref:glycosyltransferase family 4 protein n=1 Tax=Turicibacter bilis TaxID=2735723 RepID=UPI003F89DD22